MDRGDSSGLQPCGHAAGLGESRRLHTSLGCGHREAGRCFARTRGFCPRRCIQPRTGTSLPAWDTTGPCASGIWQARSAVTILPGDAEGYRIAYAADGRLVAACSRGGNVRLWNAHTHQELHVLPHGNRVYGLAFSPDGTRLATGCSDNTIRMWDIATGRDVCELRGHQAYVHAVAFSPDGTRLASASGDHTVRIWDTFQPSMRKPPTGADVVPRE